MLVVVLEPVAVSVDVPVPRISLPVSLVDGTVGTGFVSARQETEILRELVSVSSLVLDSGIGFEAW